MAKINLEEYTSLELGKMIKTKQISVVEAVEASFERINEIKDEYNCLITTNEEAALTKAALIQSHIDSGEELGNLAGVPITIKDNICTKNLRTTCGSKMLENFIPEYDATVVKNLEAAGCIVVGKNNMDEFAMGSTSESSYYGPVKNPINKEYVVGGSSGGSAAAVKLGTCMMSAGTDTGGSIRLPASYCKVTGLKPTYGTVSRYGLVAYASSMDQIGPMAKTVEECAAFLQVMASFDRKDSTSVKRKSYDFASNLGLGVKRLQVGIPVDLLDYVTDEKIKDTVYKAAHILENEGAKIVEFYMGLWDESLEVYSILADSEASSNLSRFDGVKYGFRAKTYNTLDEMYKNTFLEGFGEVVRSRIEFGRACLGPENYEKYYLKAAKVRRMIFENYKKAFEEFDVLLTPVSPVEVPRLNEKKFNLEGMNIIDICTVGTNLSGIPGISVPLGTDTNGMPIGIQLLANHFQEEMILRAGKVIEDNRD